MDFGCILEPKSDAFESQNDIKRRPQSTNMSQKSAPRILQDPFFGTSHDLPKRGINDTHHFQYKGGGFQSISPRGTQEAPEFWGRVRKLPLETILGPLGLA